MFLRFVTACDKKCMKWKGGIFVDTWLLSKWLMVFWAIFIHFFVFFGTMTTIFLKGDFFLNNIVW